jgi:RimJ/RimL family protein N-acetyltransferase
MPASPLPLLTPRVLLRALTQDDLEDLCSVWMDPGALALERVIAVVKPGNHASVRVLEKSGLRPAGARVAYGETMLLYEVSRGEAPRTR